MDMADSNRRDDSGAPAQSGDKVQVFSIPSTGEKVELEKDTIRSLHNLANILERMRLSDYITMMQNPRRLIVLNFIAGLARGFGIVVGMTVVFALALYSLSKLVDLPLIGKYIARIVEIVREELNSGGPPKF